jgi:transposase InsO family protein
MEKVIKKIQRIKRNIRRETDIRAKLELFILVLRLGNVSEACARRGFSRTFYYKWWKRFKRSNYKVNSVRETSRKPKKNPNRTKPRLNQKILHYSRWGYGAPMITAILQRKGIKIAESTVSHILRGRKKKIKLKKSKVKAHNKRYELPIPGLRMQLDVKYVPEKINGNRIYNYVIIDECSRWRFAKAYPEINHSMTIDFLNELMKLCPFPINCIQTDNGFEFTFRLHPSTNKPKHPMDEWCEQRGIRHRCIPPGEKELNGKVERSHRIDEQYFYWRAPTKSIEAFNQAQDRWLYTYNENRMHGGLGFITPMEKLAERWLELEKISYLDKDLEKIKLSFLKVKPSKEKTKKKWQEQVDALMKLAS